MTNDRASRSTHDGSHMSTRSGSSRPTSHGSQGYGGDLNATGGSEGSASTQGVVGTGLSRFLGFYNPAFDENFTKKNQEVDPGSREMQEAYQTEIRQKAANRKKDWMSVYMDEQVKYSAINKVGQGKP